jgi:hypothetical protein
MKRMTKADALWMVSFEASSRQGLFLHSKGAEDNANYIKREDVGDSNSQTDDHGKNSKPIHKWC